MAIMLVCDKQGQYQIQGAPHQITIDRSKEIKPIKWCVKTMGRSQWIMKNKLTWRSSNSEWCLAFFKTGTTFGFVSESNYMEFCLKWL